MKQKSMFFWNSLVFIWFIGCLQLDLVFLLFLNIAWTSGISQLTYCWSLTWRILSITLLVCKMSAIESRLNFLWLCLSLGLVKSDLFPVCDHCWVSKFAGVLNASSFRIWKSSTGIPSPLLALFVVMLPTCLHTPRCLTLDEWSHHWGYLSH